MEGHEVGKKWVLAVKSMTLWRRRRKKVKKKERGKVIRVTWYEGASVRRCEGLMGLRQRPYERDTSLTSYQCQEADSLLLALC